MWESVWPYSAFLLATWMTSKGAGSSRVPLTLSQEIALKSPADRNKIQRDLDRMIDQNEQDER